MEDDSTLPKTSDWLWGQTENFRLNVACSDLNECILPRFTCWNHNSLKMMVLGDGAFQQFLGHEPSWMRLVFSWKRPHREPWPFPPCGDTARGHRLWTRNKALIQPCWCLNLGLSNLQNYEREIFFLISFLNFNWRLITLWYCGGFCHIVTWISHGCT